MDESEIGMIFALKREKLGISQGALAKTIGVSRPYISQIEQGSKKPGDQTVMKIMAALDLSYRDLVPEATLENASREELAILNGTMPLIQKLADYLTPVQFNEIVMLLEKTQEATAAVQSVLRDEPIPGPEGWFLLSKEDKRLVQRIINRLLKGEAVSE